MNIMNKALQKKSIADLLLLSKHYNLSPKLSINELIAELGKSHIKQIGKMTKAISPKETLRKLFTDHAVYTKFYVNSFLDGASDIDVITKRLLENQSEIGSYLSPFITKANGQIITDKLTEHILLAAACVKSLKENSPDLSKNIEKLFKNATQVGKFLASLNPAKLSEETAVTEFKKHNQFVLDFATQRFKKQHSSEVKTYDAYYNHMLMFSDMIFSLLNTKSQKVGECPVTGAPVCRCL